MLGRYPDQVGRHKPCGPVVVMVPCPFLGLFICHDGGSFAFGRLGHPGLSPVGSWSEWLGECHGSRSVWSERHWSTRMGARGHGFCGVGIVC